MTSAFSWQNSISLCPASFCTPRLNLPFTPGVSSLPPLAFQFPIMKGHFLLGVSWCDYSHSHRARNPGMWSQVGLQKKKKHHYKQSSWRWWNPAELFQILKDDAVKVLHSICQQIWKTQQWLQDWKRSVFIAIPKKGNAKESSNYRTIALTSRVSKVMLKILQAKVQRYMNRELPDVQAGFRKGRGTRDQIANICWIIEKAREFQKNIYFCFIDYAKDFVCITTNCGKFWKRWEYQITWPASWETCMQVRKQQL